MSRSIDLLYNANLVIFDSDGCLIEEGVPYPYVEDLINLLRKANKTVVVFTNNSTKHPDQLKKHYENLGIHVDLVVNSGQLAVDYCVRNKISSVFIVGEEGLTNIFTENQIKIQQDGVDAVIVGMDRTLTYDKLAIATRLIRNGARFIATNPDKSFPTPRGLEPGAGSMIAALEASSDKVPEIILGKPNTWGYDLILEKYKISKHKAVMLGDRYETDILGAIRSGIEGIIMKTGVMADRIKNKIQLDIGNTATANSIEELYLGLKKTINQ